MNRKSICNTLGQGNDKNKYYVYMLCDKSTKQPFYIGKGQDLRVFDHEKSTEKLRNNIKKAIEENFEERGFEMSDKKIQKAIEDEMNNAPDKIAEISKLLNSGNLETVIIKWGLTEQEAYMTESALINMYKFIGGENSLTNIANGHMSKKEKDNRYCKTEAQKIEDFAKNCAQTEKSLTDILKVYFGEDYTDKTPKDDGCGILFVKINNLYPICKGSDSEGNKILDAASGFWNVGQKKLDKIEYVFALYQSQVVGIYPVNKDSWKTKGGLGEIKIDKESGKAVSTATGRELPFALKDVVREKEYDEINDQIENRTLKKENYKMFFEATDLTDAQKKKLTKMRGNFMDKYIIDVPGKQNPVSYNFDADGEFRKDTEEKKTTKKKN